MRRSKRWRPGDHPRARWLAPLIPAVLALTLVATACGGSSGGDGVASARGTNGSNSSKRQDSEKKDPYEAGLEFARCMREHGIDVPDPEPGQGGLIKVGPGAPGDVGGGGAAAVPLEGSAFQEADKACRHLLGDLIQDGAGPADPAEQDRALKFAQCMREHGVNMPDPEFKGGGISVKIEGVDPESETFKEAQKACAEFFGPGKGAGFQAREARS